MARIRPVVLIGAVLLIAAIAAFVAGRIADDPDPASEVGGFHRLALGQGGTTLELDAGIWVGYYEAPGPVTSVADVPNFRAFILDGDSDQVNVENAASPTRYTYRGKSGLAILQFSAPQPGRYRIVLHGAGAPPPGADLAIGRDVSDPGSAESAASLPVVLEVLAGMTGIGLLGWAWTQRAGRRHVVSGGA